MAFTDLLNNILKAVYGKDVRQSIHDAIKQCKEEVDNGIQKCEDGITTGLAQCRDLINTITTQHKTEVDDAIKQCQKDISNSDSNIQKGRIDALINYFFKSVEISITNSSRWHFDKGEIFFDRGRDYASMQTTKISVVPGEIYRIIVEEDPQVYYPVLAAKGDINGNAFEMRDHLIITDIDGVWDNSVKVPEDTNVLLISSGGYIHGHRIEVYKLKISKESGDKVW